MIACLPVSALSTHWQSQALTLAAAVPCHRHGDGCASVSLPRRDHDVFGCECLCVFITAVPIKKLSAGGWGGRGRVEDMCYERLRAEASVN